MNGLNPRCWLAAHGWMEGGREMPLCSGRLVRARLLPQRMTEPAVAADPRSWVWACGGPTGVEGHHGMLDCTRSLRVDFGGLPFGLVQLAEGRG